MKYMDREEKIRVGVDAVLQLLHNFFMNHHHSHSLSRSFLGGLKKCTYSISAFLVEQQPLSTESKHYESQIVHCAILSQLSTGKKR